MKRAKRHSLLRRTLLAYVILSGIWGFLVTARVQHEIASAERSALHAEVASRMEATVARIEPLLAQDTEPLRGAVESLLATEHGLLAVDILASRNDTFRLRAGATERAPIVQQREFWIDGQPDGPPDYIIRVGMTDELTRKTEGRGISVIALWMGLVGTWVIGSAIYRSLVAKTEELHRLVDAALSGQPGVQLALMTGQDEFATLGRKLVVALQIHDDVSSDVAAANDTIRVVSSNSTSSSIRAA